MSFRKSGKYERILSAFADLFFFLMGVTLNLAALAIMLLSLWKIFTCSWEECNLLKEVLNMVSYSIIAVAIFDVGRYLLEEEVFRDRKLRSPSEARRSLTKFMVIIVVAVTLESLLATITATTTSLSSLIYPALLFFVAVLLLVGLGLYQRLSVLAEKDTSDFINKDINSLE